MNFSAEHIQGLAAETGFRAETLEKVIRLGELAADIGRHPLLSRVLVLKGGTALNLMFGSPARLSVDLDFNYIGQEERAGMLADRPEVERAILIIGKGQGYRVQQSRDAHAGNQGTDQLDEGRCKIASACELRAIKCSSHFRRNRIKCKLMDFSKVTEQ